MAAARRRVPPTRARARCVAPPIGGRITTQPREAGTSTFSQLAPKPNPKRKRGLAAAGKKKETSGKMIRTWRPAPRGIRGFPLPRMGRMAESESRDSESGAIYFHALGSKRAPASVQMRKHLQQCQPRIRPSIHSTHDRKPGVRTSHRPLRRGIRFKLLWFGPSSWWSCMQARYGERPLHPRPLTTRSASCASLIAWYRGASGGQVWHLLQRFKRLLSSHTEPGGARRCSRCGGMGRRGGGRERRGAPQRVAGARRASLARACGGPPRRTLERTGIHTTAH